MSEHRQAAVTFLKCKLPPNCTQIKTALVFRFLVLMHYSLLLYHQPTDDDSHSSHVSLVVERWEEMPRRNQRAIRQMWRGQSGHSREMTSSEQQRAFHFEVETSERHRGAGKRTNLKRSNDCVRWLCYSRNSARSEHHNSTDSIPT